MHDYISGGYRAVPGWTAPQEPLLFSLVDAAQTELEVYGDLLEIGVFKGQMAVLLGYLQKEKERLILCDLFDGVATNEYSARENEHYHDLQLEDFLNHYYRYHEQRPEIVVGPSNTLSDHCKPSSFRLVHIDGSHMYPDVMGDLLLSRALVCGPEAIVVIDDIRQSHTPGVWAAAWECVATKGLVPLILSEKMYATWGSPPRELVGRLRDSIKAHPALVSAEHPVRGGTVLQVNIADVAPAKRSWAHEWVPPGARRILSRALALLRRVRALRTCLGW